jgi:hypothetical protein
MATAHRIRRPPNDAHRRQPIPALKKPLLRDYFTGSLSAGSVNSTAAAPGPGTRTVIDTANHISVSNKLDFDGGKSAWGDPGLWYAGLTRAPGQMLLARIDAKDAGSMLFGLDQNQSGTIRTGTNLGGAYSINASTAAATSMQILGRRLSSSIDLCLIQRANGYMWLMNQMGKWELLWANTAESWTPEYPALASYASAFNCLRIIAPKERYLPSPTVSDGFSTTTSDGLGHAETSGPGAGGSSQTWSDSIGTWGVSAGACSAAALAGGLAVRTVDCKTPHLILDIAITHAAGSAGLVFWYQDDSNYCTAYTDATDLKITQTVAGVTTEIASVAITYSAGAVLRVVIKDRIIRAYYNGVYKSGPELCYYPDLTSQTRAGLYTTSTLNTFDNFTAYAIGLEGQHNRLNKHLPRPITQEIIHIGDSKVWPNPAYIPELSDKLAAASIIQPAYYTTRRVWSYPGYDTTEMATIINDLIDTLTNESPYRILINLGINDCPSMPTEAAYKANYASILDALHAAFPTAKIICMIVWGRGYATECNTLANWQADVISTRSTWAKLGPDERIFLENSDDGATYTADGIHPTAAGYTLTAEQWKDAIIAPW